MNVNVFTFNRRLMYIRKNLRTILDNSRYEHTVAVAFMAIALAMKYDCDLHKAELAGLLHDCAKCLSNEKKLNESLKYNIPVSELESRHPHLLHAKLGAFYAMKKYHVDDTDIINAIRKHTTGAPAMSMLEKIIYVADFIEPNRANIVNLREIRRIAFEDIDLAVYMILKNSIDFLNNSKLELDETTVEAFQYYKNLFETRKENFKDDSN